MTELKTITRADWIEALRSGKYEQGRNSLRYNDNYCCLGVACEIAGVTLSQDDGLTSAASKLKRSLATSSLDMCLETKPVHDMLDLGQLITYGYHGMDSLQSSLANMNDRGHSFKEIADYIESLEKSHD